MGLVLWLPLINDYHNQGLNDYEISTLGTISWPTDGKLGATCFQGGDGTQIQNGLRIEDNFINLLNGNYTVSVWVKPFGNHVHYNGSIFSSGNWNTANKRWAFGVNQTNTKVDVLCSNYNTYIDCSVPVNEWTHLVCTCDIDRIVKLYKNGEYIGSLDRSASNTFDSDYTWSGIGRESYANGYFSFNGCLQDFRLYDEALSPLEIKRIAQGLILHYPLNDSYIESTTNLITTEDCLSNTCYNGATSKYSYGTTTDMYKEVTTFDGKKGTKVYMGTDGLAAYPYVYVNNMYTSDGTNSPAYKTLSFDYYTTISTSISPYKLGSGTGTATYKVTNNTGTKTGTGTNSVTIPVVPYTWNHVEVIFHGTTEADSQWGYIQNRPSHTSDTSNFWFFANMQLETKDHATPYAGVGGNRDEVTIYDCSGYCRNGEKIGTVTISDNAPRYLTSTHITNGASTRIATPSLTLPFNAITLNIWFRSTNTSPTGNYHMVIDSVANRQWYEMCINNTGYLRAGLFVNGTRYADNCTTKTALDGNWHMLTITYDGTIIKRYFDAVMEKSTSITATTGLSSPTVIMLGRDGPNANYACIDVDLSDFRIYATALSAEDVKALYENSAYVATDGTMYAYEFVEE